MPNHLSDVLRIIYLFLFYQAPKFQCNVIFASVCLSYKIYILSSLSWGRDLFQPFPSISTLPIYLVVRERAQQHRNRSNLLIYAKNLSNIWKKTSKVNSFILIVFILTGWIKMKHQYHISISRDKKKYYHQKISMENLKYSR